MQIFDPKLPTRIMSLYILKLLRFLSESDVNLIRIFEESSDYLPVHIIPVIRIRGFLYTILVP